MALSINDSRSKHVKLGIMLLLFIHHPTYARLSGYEDATITEPGTSATTGQLQYDRSECHVSAMSGVIQMHVVRQCRARDTALGAVESSRQHSSYS